VLIEQEEASLFEAGARRQELGEDVFTATVLFQHLAQAADLAFDAGQPILEFLAVVALHGLHHLLTTIPTGGMLMASYHGSEACQPQRRRPGDNHLEEETECPTHEK
jgi:hypothetical protein